MNPRSWSPAARTGVVVVAVAGAALVVVAATLVPWAWLPGQQVRAVSARTVFTAAQVQRFEDVSWMFRLASWGGLAVGLGVSVWLGLTRSGTRLLGRLPGPWVVRVLLATGAVTLAGALARLPFGVRSQDVARGAGLSRQGWGSWALDELITVAITAVSTALVLAIVVGIARRAPRSWPAWAAAAAAGLAFGGSFVYPVVVEPVFNDFTSLPDGRLRTEIFALAAAEGVPIDDVLVADASRRTTTLNAYVSGFGSTRRVVLYDTVLTGLPRPEIEVIVAHELGHAKHDDVLLGTTLGALGAAAGVGLLGVLLSSPRLLRRAGASGPGDPRVVGALLALAAVGTLVASPVENTISRAIEARADRTSLEATGATDTFIAMQRELTLRSLSDPTPPWLSQLWFGSHPTVLQRVALAEQLAGRQSGPR